MEGAHTSMFLAIVVLCDPIGSFKFSIASIIMPSSLQESHRIKVKHSKYLVFYDCRDKCHKDKCQVCIRLPHI
jgi:hypothetical protein